MDTTVDEDMFELIGTTSDPNSAWEIRPDQSVSLRGGSTAVVTVETPQRRLVWRIAVDSGEEIAVLDALAVGDDLVVHALSRGLIHLWRLTDDAVLAEVTVELRDTTSFAGDRSTFWVGAHGEAVLGVVAATSETMSFV